MASPDAIRRALLNLLGAKKANKEALATDSGAIGRPATPNDMINTEINLGDARQQARQAQGVDPLAAKQPNQNALAIRARQEKARAGEEDFQAFSKDTDTFPDDALSDPAEVRSMALRGEDEAGRLNRLDVDAEIAADQARQIAQEFEQLVGRPPTPEELARPQDMQRVIEILGLGRDEIPF